MKAQEKDLFIPIYPYKEQSSFSTVDFVKRSTKNNPN